MSVAPPVATTYTTLLKALRDLALSDEAVKTFRVGPLSSVEIETGTDPITTNSYKYPAIHLVPQQFVMNGRSTVFEFDMIVFDLAKDNLNLQHQIVSECLEITRDLMAKFVLTDWGEFRFNLEMPATGTPFSEGFQNNPTGVTTRMRIEAITPLNLCDAPFKP